MSAAPAKNTVGFIGLGAMGIPIAKNLLAAPQVHLKVWNRSAHKTDTFRSELPEEEAVRVTAVPTIHDTVSDEVGCVFSVVSNDAALEAIVTDILPRMSKSSPPFLHVCLSTVSPATSEKMAGLHAAQGAVYVACPVFGRPEAAAARKLIAVPAGPKEAVDRIAPLLASIAQKVVYAGPNPASASILKLCGNFMILSVLEMMGESFALGEAHGVPREVAYDLLAGPTGLLNTLPIITNYGRMVAHQTFTPVGFTAVNGLKDARLITGAAAAVGLDMPLAATVQGRLEAVVARPGGGEQDWASFTGDIKPAGGAAGGAAGQGR